MQITHTKLVSKVLALVVFVSCSFGSFFAFSAIDEYEFETEEQQQSFRKLTDEMRCPKCLNANLSGSDAPIAADLRAEIYDQIIEGQEDEEIIEFMRSRYGDFILYRPPVNSGTFVLWFGPGILLLAGFLILRRMLKEKPSAEASIELSKVEEERLQALLAENDGESS